MMAHYSRLMGRGSGPGDELANLAALLLATGWTWRDLMETPAAVADEVQAILAAKAMAAKAMR